MLVGCLGILMLAAGFVTEVPPLIAAKLAVTNETRGTFVQTKTDVSGRAYRTTGTYRIRPGVDFEWRTCEPFETRFYATPTNYVYSNEDETVTRRLSELPQADRFAALGTGDVRVFFKAFDALYKEESGRFFVKAKPKAKDLQRVLKRIDAEGSATNWTLTATFANGASIRLDLSDRVP